VPLWIVTGMFAAFVGALVYLMWPSATGSVVTTGLYRLLVLGGAGMVIIELLTGITVWLVARAHADRDEKRGLALTLWTRALAWTAGGVVLWWIGLLVLDLRHVGIFG
jgi:hypothetical protein